MLTIEGIYDGEVVRLLSKQSLPANIPVKILIEDLPGTVQVKNENIKSLFGLLQAQRGVNLEAMDATLRERAKARFNDRD